MAEIREIVASECIEHAAPLLLEHWEEVAKNKQVMVLNPDVERYRLMESAGMVMSLGAFIDGEMVGYSVSFIGTHLHYAGLIYANNDVIYVRKDCRNGKAGVQLIKETERMAKERGAKLMLWHAKESTAFDSLLPRLGYGVQDVIYSKGI